MSKVSDSFLLDAFSLSMREREERNRRKEE